MLFPAMILKYQIPISQFHCPCPTHCAETSPYVCIYASNAAGKEQGILTPTPPPFHRRGLGGGRASDAILQDAHRCKAAAQHGPQRVTLCPQHQRQALSPALLMGLTPSHRTPRNWSCSPSPGDKNTQEGKLLSAQRTDSCWMLLRSCATGGTKGQDMDPRWDRGSGSLQNPGDFGVDSTALLSLLRTLLRGRKHRVFHADRKIYLPALATSSSTRPGVPPPPRLMGIAPCLFQTSPSAIKIHGSKNSYPSLPSP